MIAYISLLLPWRTSSEVGWYPNIQHTFLCSCNQYITQDTHFVILHLWHTSAPTCFDTVVPFSGRHYVVKFVDCNRFDTRWQ